MTQKELLLKAVSDLCDEYADDLVPTDQAFVRYLAELGNMFISKTLE